ncbi:MAG: methyltransferase domain-containing protein [Burkholderiaceae bacterium]|jgi:GT2 family glycosyltransferase/2-polyprenyl-3-methyl-5-hydroxy-6-metoxy-1,4-benzoquinol methylase/glycosyltransferase involved in cell wall biosynthesis|nr:methyltransferase domain-containing protein [Burkholderiaceae bacterium]
MSMTLPPNHIYRREISGQIRTSLSVIVGLIGRGKTVLDLGTGSGALGKYLTTSNGCLVDGVTDNPEEASLAQSVYRSLVVADLETCSLQALFAEEKYDYIVCADVLEHLRNSQRILDECKKRLAPNGKLIISVPNIGYSGLVAELMSGEFLYRDEGLLDKTHVHFFTRRSLHRFLQFGGWKTPTIEIIERPLNESEFTVQFDSLPPPVSRHLLSLPDALTYQIVALTEPTSMDCGTLENQTNVESQASPQAAVFSCQLYSGTEYGYREDRKLVASGVIGKSRQTIKFKLDRDLRSTTGLRFDPADRAGYLYLFTIELRVGSNAIWTWNFDESGVATLLGTALRQQILVHPPVAGNTGALLLLTGADPWFELPIPANLLACEFSEPVELAIELGWPMSADYMALAETVNAQRQNFDTHIEETAWRLETMKEDHRQALQSVADRFHNSQIVDLQLVDALRAARAEQEVAVSFQIQYAESLRLKLEAQQTNHAFELNSANEAINILQMQASVLKESVKSAESHILQLVGECKRTADERSDLVARLGWLENSRVFKLTRPLVRAKMLINPLLRAFQGSTNTLTAAKFVPPSKLSLQVDIVIPVYKGLDDTQRCINSVLSNPCKTPFRVVVINDASPESEVTNWLREISLRDSRILLLENKENLGFVGTVNRGMSVSDSHDIVLLNSDTEVANDWLDRLQHSAYVGDRVGTVTPFSNNATICSYPTFCAENPMISGHTTASLDKLFSQANKGEVVDIPTGVGFCMYIRRECLSSVGLFDVANFGKGYGEENDFCRRAAAAGWRNLHALDTFVLHAGGVSFGSSKNDRVLAALQTLARLYPDYDSLVQKYVKNDPAASYRHAVDILRVQASGKPSVLLILHDRSGGTIRHAHELAEHLKEFANFFTLTPTPGGAVCLRLLGQDEAFSLTYLLADEMEKLVQCLCSVGIGLVHYHHLIGHHDSVLQIPNQLAVPYDFTVHDYFSYCPQISLTDVSNKYCGETGIDQCRQCLNILPAPGSMSIDAWRSKYRSFLSGARFVLTPSRDVKNRISRFLSSDNIRFVPHTDLSAAEKLPAPQPNIVGHGEKLRIVVVGALSPIKGADILEEVAYSAFKSDLPLEFHLVGYAYRSLKTLPDCNLTIHGAYAENDLARILNEIQPDVVWFPALWPETYSYTLSACLLHGLPIVAPDIGAFAERLSRRHWTWIQPWNRSTGDWAIFFSTIRSDHFVTGIPPKLSPAVPQFADCRPCPTWSYTSDYLKGVGLRPDLPILSHANLRPFLTQSSGRMPSVHIALKVRALKALTRLRSMRSMSGLARAVPLRWQTRIKSWLNT